MEYNVGAVNLSKSAFKIVKRMLNGENVTFETSGITKREWQELQNILQESANTSKI